MQPLDFVNSISNFSEQSRVGQVKILAWYLHTYKNKETFSTEDLRNCFRSAQFEPPDLSVYLPRMASKKPPQVLKGRGGYRLDGAVRRKLDAKHGDSPSRITVPLLMSKLPEKVPNLAERIFLQEALDCYRIKAYRASIVMTWSLAFDHVCEWILNDSQRLASFNSALQVKFPKKGHFSKRTDFEELQERDIIELGRVSKILPKNISTILGERLNRRNMAAHPSAIKFEQVQADDMITDLINNVVIALD